MDTRNSTAAADPTVPASITVKICGLTHPDDALAAVESGANWLGLVLYPHSPRYIDPKRARALVHTVRAAIHDCHVDFVGVFVNSAPETVRELTAFIGLDRAQLHGDETLGAVTQLGPSAFKAIRLRPGLDRQIDAYARLAGQSAPALLLDAYHANQYGGTGGTVDWDLAREVAAKYPILLAGGLTPENVARAIVAVRPWGVDVSSGVEAAPGRKDHIKMRAFVAAANETGRRIL